MSGILTRFLLRCARGTSTGEAQWGSIDPNEEYLDRIDNSKFIICYGLNPQGAVYIWHVSSCDNIDVFLWTTPIYRVGNNAVLLVGLFQVVHDFIPCRCTRNIRTILLICVCPRKSCAFHDSPSHLTFVKLTSWYIHFSMRYSLQVYNLQSLSLIPSPEIINKTKTWLIRFDVKYNVPRDREREKILSNIEGILSIYILPTFFFFLHLTREA